MPSYQYRKFHCGDKTIFGPSYLHNSISYTGKMTSLYWIEPPTDGSRCTETYHPTDGQHNPWWRPPKSKDTSILVISWWSGYHQHTRIFTFLTGTLGSYHGVLNVPEIEPPADPPSSGSYDPHLVQHSPGYQPSSAGLASPGTHIPADGPVDGMF